jgi:hypothetical protein
VKVTGTGVVGVVPVEVPLAGCPVNVWLLRLVSKEAL